MAELESGDGAAVEPWKSPSPQGASNKGTSLHVALVGVLKWKEGRTFSSKPSASMDGRPGVSEQAGWKMASRGHDFATFTIISPPSLYLLYSHIPKSFCSLHIFFLLGLTLYLRRSSSHPSYPIDSPLHVFQPNPPRSREWKPTKILIMACLRLWRKRSRDRPAHRTATQRQSTQDDPR